MLLEQLKSDENLTTSEKQIAAYILKNPIKIADLTATELGKKTYTSKSTVLRMCQKLNLPSYNDLQRKLELEVNEKARLITLLEQEPINKETTVKEIINIIPSLYDQAISNVKTQINVAAFNRIIHRLKTVDKLDIYGLGITSSCAEAAKFKFQSIGIDCSTQTGINEHYLMATKKMKNRVAIVISFTGSNETMIATAKYLRKMGTYVIGIGGLVTDKLQKNCDEYLTSYSSQHILSMEVISPYISITYIFDLLFSALLIQNYDQNAKYAINVIDYRGNIE